MRRIILATFVAPLPAPLVTLLFTLLFQFVGRLIFGGSSVTPSLREFVDGLLLYHLYGIPSAYFVMFFVALPIIAILVRRKVISKSALLILGATLGLVPAIFFFGEELLCRAHLDINPLSSGCAKYSLRPELFNESLYNFVSMAIPMAVAGVVSAMIFLKIYSPALSVKR